MSTYKGSLHAMYVHNELLMAHTHSHAQGMEHWEKACLERALQYMADLQALEPFIRHRLEQVTNRTQTPAQDPLEGQDEKELT